MREVSPRTSYPGAGEILPLDMPMNVCVTENDGSFKANISAVFIADNTFRIVLYKILGLLTLGTIRSVLLLAPFALMGLFTGMKCCGHMDEKTVRRITIALLILSGISLVLKNL